MSGRRLPFSFPVLLIVSVWLHTAAVTADGHARRLWELVREGDLHAGLHDASVPVKRYGSLLTLGEGGDRAILYSGYLMDFSDVSPMWLNDCWVLRHGEHSARWEEVQLGRRWSSREPIAPRYKAASAVLPPPFQHLTVLYGGGTRNAKTVLGEMLIMDSKSLTLDVMNQQASPGPLLSAAMVALDDRHLALFGGMQRDGAHTSSMWLGTVQWEPNEAIAREVTWSALTNQFPERTRTPEGRRAAVFVDIPSSCDSPQCRLVESAKGRTVLLFGGFGGSDVENMNDVWQAVVKTEAEMVTWELLHDGDGGESAAPNPRGGAVGAVAKASRSGARFLYIALGATCDVECTTRSDVWRFSVESRSWMKLSADPHAMPTSRQFAASVRLTPTSLMIFGGEGFQPYAYWNDVWSLRLDPDADEADATSPQPSLSSPAVSWYTAASVKGRVSLQSPIRSPGVLRSGNQQSQNSGEEEHGVPFGSLASFLALGGFVVVVLVLRVGSPVHARSGAAKFKRPKW